MGHQVSGEGRVLLFGGGGQGWLSGPCGEPVVPPNVDASVVHVARMYDYLLGRYSS